MYTVGWKLIWSQVITKRGLSVLGHVHQGRILKHGL